MKKGAHKLAIHDIQTIFDMYNSGMNHNQISKAFVSSRKHQVTRRHIGSIINGERWQEARNQKDLELKD